MSVEGERFRLEEKPPAKRPARRKGPLFDVPD